MILKYIRNGVFTSLFLVSVVYNSKIKTNEPTLSEISKNISVVNHLLRDLLMKYAALKNISKVNKKEANQLTKTKFNKSFKDPQKFVSTLFYTDQSIEDSGNDVNEKKIDIENETYKDNKRVVDSFTRESNSQESEGSFATDHSSENNKKITNYQRPNKHKVFRLNDGISTNPREINDKIFETKDFYVKSEKKIDLNEQNMKTKKKGTLNDYSDVENEGKNDIREPKDIEKILVIHIGPREDTIKTRVSTHTDVFKSTTKKKQNPTKSIVFRSDTTTDPNSDIEDNKAMKAEILRAKSLREALGDACTLLVNRKCKNALKSVLKDICKKNRKCKSEFNDEFTKNSNSACDEQFTKERSLVNKKRTNDKSFRDYSDFNDDYAEENYRSGEEKLTGARFIDYTRQGLDMTCLQSISDVKEHKTAERTNITKINTKTKHVNILRDKLEDACRKACFNKCKKACNSASNKTCNKHECIKAKKKALSKRCDARCKETFQYEGSRESKSGSGSDEDSDDADDSDSE